jgi:hypothetical protein
MPIKHTVDAAADCAAMLRGGSFRLTLEAQLSARTLHSIRIDSRGQNVCLASYGYNQRFPAKVFRLPNSKGGIRTGTRRHVAPRG